jgi:2-methylcitrate dehydratase PrpD
MPDSYSLEVARRVLEACSKPSSEVLELARMSLVDTVAVAAAVPPLNPLAGSIASRLAGSREGDAIIPGLWRRAPPMEAGAASAFLAHSLELDDWLAPAFVHAGSVVVPVILSQALDLSILDSLKAVVSGYEAAYWVGSYLGRKHYETWHSTATAGAVAAAVTAIISEEGCDANIESLVASIETASSYIGGTWELARSAPALKPASPAAAVTLGMLASRTVLATLSKVRPVVGVLEKVCGLLGGECRRPREPRGPAIKLNGFKFYPSCRHTHTAIEAAERLAGMIGDPTQIEAVEVQVFKEAATVAHHLLPSSIEEARFSLAYLVALALVRGCVNVESLREGLSNTEVLRLAERVRVKVSEEYSKAYPERQPATVRVYLKGGAVLEESVEHPRGDPARGVKLEDLLEKASELSRLASDTRVIELAEGIARAGLQAKLRELIEPLAH